MYVEMLASIVATQFANVDILRTSRHHDFDIVRVTGIFHVTRHHLKIIHIQPNLTDILLKLFIQKTDLTLEKDIEKEGNEGFYQFIFRVFLNEILPYWPP